MRLESWLLHPAVQAVGRALLHFVWQGGALAALFLAADRLTRRSQARLRYAMACLTMLAMPGIFVTTALWSYRVPESASTAPSTGAAGAAGVASPREAPGAVRADDRTYWPLRREPSALPGWAVCIWLAGVAVLSIATMGGWIRVRRLTRRGLQSADPAWTATLADLMRRLEISRPVRLCTSALAEVPSVAGWARPYILLPVSALSGLSEPQLRAILAHELAHIRRHDYLVNLLQNAVETLLFYHPAVWWISRRVRQERENCCDDLAVAVCGDAIEYAGALAQLEELRGGMAAPALAATGGDLLSRIRRLTGEPAADGIPGSLGAAVAGALVLGAGMAAQVQPPKPAAPAPEVKFDVASIRPCDPHDNVAGGRGRKGDAGGGSSSVSPGRLAFQCMTLWEIIDSAYVLNSDRPLLNAAGLPFIPEHVRGGPAWIRSERFSIEAETDNPAASHADPRFDRPGVKLMRGPMLRALLEDRFQLKMHRETEDVPMYSLSVAKGGLKLKPMQAGDCVVNQPGHGQPKSDKPLCNWMGWGVHGPNRTLEGGGIPLSGLAELLGDWIMDRHVIDRTGIATVFNIHLEYAPDESTPLRNPGPGMDPVDPNSDIPPGAGIFTALEKQLGLKLEPVKGPREYYMIDRVERPSTN